MKTYLWRRFAPRCKSPAPEKLPDAGPCARWRGHLSADGGWHADGQGYIWNDEVGHWRWMGPVVDLLGRDVHPDDPRRPNGFFERNDG
jgi:hypothetical protein